MEKYKLNNSTNQRDQDIVYSKEIELIWQQDDGDLIDKLRSFMCYVPYTEFTKLFCKYELFNKILNYHGSVVECGVHRGNGLLTWAHLSNILEPVNHIRKVVGFDTFSGFPSVSTEDASNHNTNTSIGTFNSNDNLEHLQRVIKNFDSIRFLGHIDKVELVKGDACETIPNYIINNKHFLVSLLYLDFDIYEPTLSALENFIPRMHKGSIIAFDQLNNKHWPGETLAYLKKCNINTHEIHRFTFNPQISYIIV